MDVEYESSSAPVDSPGTLESDLGPEMYQELRTAFLDLLPSQVDALRAASGVGDLDGAQYVAHQIKGTAPGFGATRLDELAQQVMQMDGDQIDLLQAVVTQIDAEVSALRNVARV
jgi:HPt (histidine-containing phosphotransfer) domain-containing protein